MQGEMGHQLSNTAPHRATAKQNNDAGETISIKKMHGARTVRPAPP